MKTRRNPKSEIRNPKEIRSPKSEPFAIGTVLRPSAFELLSDFGFRISDFKTPSPWLLRVCIMIAFACVWLVRLSASELETAFDQANKLFERGKYSEAATAYEKLIDAGHVSPSLYFNLGNACFKAGQPGHAIVAYRRAELLTPRDADVQANLAFVRKSINGVASPGEGWQRGLGQLTVDEWSLAASFGLWLCFLLLAAREARPAWRARFRKLLITAGAVTGLAGICLWLAWVDRFGARSAVVVVVEAVVRNGPLEESPSKFQLRDGAEVAVIDEKDEWLAVRDAARREGWMRRSQLAFPSVSSGVTSLRILKSPAKI